MAEPVGSGTELDGHEGVTPRRLEEAIAVSEHVIDHGLANDLRQMLMDQQPLVVPERYLPGDQVLEIAAGAPEVRADGMRRRSRWGSSSMTRL